MFGPNGVVSKKSLSIWSANRLSDYNQVLINSTGARTWSIISNECLIGPNSFENENLTGKNFRIILIHSDSHASVCSDKTILFHSVGLLQNTPIELELI